jgi:hypothetical protein
MGKCWEGLMVALKAVGLDDKLFVHKSVKFHVVDDPLVVATAAFVKLGVLAYVLWAMFDPAQRQYFAFEVPGGSTATAPRAPRVVGAATRRRRITLCPTSTKP